MKRIMACFVAVFLSYATPVIVAVASLGSVAVQAASAQDGTGEESRAFSLLDPNIRIGTRSVAYEVRVLRGDRTSTQGTMLAVPGLLSHWTMEQEVGYLRSVENSGGREVPHTGAVYIGAYAQLTPSVEQGPEGQPLVTEVAFEQRDLVEMRSIEVDGVRIQVPSLHAMRYSGKLQLQPGVPQTVSMDDAAGAPVRLQITLLRSKH